MSLSRNKPIGIRIGPITNYLVSGPNNVSALWHHRKYVSAEHTFIQVLQRVLGVPAQDGILLEAERPVQGIVSRWLRATRKTAGKGVWQIAHRTISEQLTSLKAATTLNHIFIRKWGKQLIDIPTDGIPVSLSDLFRCQGFRASTMTLAGDGLFDVAPAFDQDFWLFDEFFNIFMFGWPEVFAKEVYATRERLLQTTEAWLSMAERNVDWAKIMAENPDWEPHFGHRLIREIDVGLVHGGISKRGCAALELAMLWAVNVNSIPTMANIVTYILLDQTLKERIEVEVFPIMSWSTDGIPYPDMEKLVACQLLHSVYLETLRHRANIGVTGLLLRDISVGGYNLQAGNMVTVPTIIAHHGSEWDVEDHPDSEFWPERFLGPVKESSSPQAAIMPPTLSINTTAATEQKRFKAGSFFPFGAGGIMCPGRFFAKLEILAAVAMLLAMFDISIDEVNDIEEKVGWKHSKQPRGVMWPEKDVRVLFRRRSYH